MAVLSFSLTHRAHNLLKMLIETHHCQCKCAFLNSSNHGITEREHIATISATRRFDHCSLYCRCRYLNCSCRATYSPYADVQVCCIRDRLGFLCPSCFCFRLCSCLSDHRDCFFLCSGPFPWPVSAPSTSMGIWSAPSARRRSTTSAPNCA